MSKVVGIFYNAHSPNMVMSRDPRKNFENVLFSPNSTFNIEKSHKISSAKATYFRSYQPKTSLEGGGGGGWKTSPPVPLRLRYS